ncbi:uncharacterized protein il11a isoform X3 [Corythoichthys intestinalis]|uniref:uncharacterized protein il11a isoform X3 n=1 Tax=Corythoichthys intestinalis TaxID=161448 RepID=UPI0025A5E7FE|nr:uncharacterized protein il11a isoform X3 [Corythoichthys intestinalis]
MKLLPDSSSSLLFSLLLAQLPVFTSASPLPQRRPNDMDKLSNQTRNLMKLTQELLLKPTLSQLHADLKLYEHHFEWLNRVSKKHHHPALPKLARVIREMKSLINLLGHQMQRVDATKVPHPTPSLPSHLSYQFDVLQSSQDLLHHFKLFCDWAYRAFISLKPKITTVQ